MLQKYLQSICTCISQQIPDHLVAMCLYVKMTAMCEDVLFIESVTVNSLQSRTVSHCFGDADGGSSFNMIYSKMIR